MAKHTYYNQYRAHLGTGDQQCIVPDQVADDQRAYDGKTFIALSPDGRRLRARLVGDDYDLWGSGTGDMVVRPVRWL